jgi:phenylalanyl-tRNA synthetase alpha subunit
MGTINFYLPKDLIEELDKVQNRSALVADLLRDYFNKGKPLTEIKEQKIKQIDTIAKEVEVLEEEISEEEKQRRKDKEAMDLEYDEVQKEKKQRVSDMIKATWHESFVKNWDIPADRLEDLFNEFVFLNESQPITIIEFMQFKLIQPKQKHNSES